METGSCFSYTDAVGWSFRLAFSCCQHGVRKYGVCARYVYILSVCHLGILRPFFRIYDSCTQRSYVFICHQNNPENKASCSYLGFSRVGSSPRMKDAEMAHMKIYEMARKGVTCACMSKFFHSRL